MAPPGAHNLLILAELQMLGVVPPEIEEGKQHPEIDQRFQEAKLGMELRPTHRISHMLQALVLLPLLLLLLLQFLVLPRAPALLLAPTDKRTRRGGAQRRLRPFDLAGDAPRAGEREDRRKS